MIVVGLGISREWRVGLTTSWLLLTDLPDELPLLPLMIVTQTKNVVVPDRHIRDAVRQRSPRGGRKNPTKHVGIILDHQGKQR
jgi:hypothetical protein